MGLFGGFKANFTSRLRKKKKEEGVVCLKYLVNSEFDDVRNTSTHAESTTKPKRPVLKCFNIENSNRVQTNLHKQILNQIDSNRKNNEYEYPVQSKNAEATNSRSTEKPRENSSYKNPDETTTNSLYRPSSSSLEIKVDQEDIYDGYEVVTPVEEYKNIVSDSKKQDNSSPPVLLTQSCIEEGQKNVENGEDNFETNIQAVKSSEDNDFTKLPFKIKDPEEQFQVHLVQTDSNRDYSCSEDELSETEEDIPEYTSMGYSSQAASIFFGEDEKPKASRPRRIIFSGNGEGPDEDEC